MNAPNSAANPQNRHGSDALDFVPLGQLAMLSSPTLPGALVDCSLLNIGAIALGDWPYGEHLLPYVLSPFTEVFIVHDRLYVDAVSAQSPLHKGVPSDLSELIFPVSPEEKTRELLLQVATHKVDHSASSGKLAKLLSRMRIEMGNEAVDQGLSLISSYYHREHRAYSQARVFGKYGSAPRQRRRFAKTFGVPDVLILVATRAHFYSAFASYYGLSYIPSVERSQIVRDDISDMTLRFAHTTIQTVTDAVAKLRQDYADAATEFFRQHVFQIRVPLVLAAVLRSCDHLSQIPARVMELRDTREAGFFRAWCQELSEWCNTDIARASKEIGRLEDDIQLICSDLRRALGLESGEQSHMDIHVSAMSGEIREQVQLPHMVFLRSIAEEAIKVAGIQQELRRILHHERRLFSAPG